MRPAFMLTTATLLGSGLALAQQPAQQPAQRGQNKPEPVAKEEIAHKPVSRDAEIKVFPLKYAAASEISSTLQKILGGVIETRVIADARTNVLLVAVENAKDLARVEPLIQALDQPVSADDRTAGGMEVQSVRLAHASARGVVNQLEKLLLNNRIAHVNIVADTSANAVWISGPGNEVARFNEVARAMDEQAAQPVSREKQGRELKFYSLKEADAGSLSSTLNRAAELLALDAEVVPDMQSGTILAIATPESHKRLEQIINTLDVMQRRPARPAAPAAAPARDGINRPAPASETTPKPNGR